MKLYFSLLEGQKCNAQELKWESHEHTTDTKSGYAGNHLLGYYVFFVVLVFDLKSNSMIFDWIKCFIILTGYLDMDKYDRQITIIVAK